jgi:hypothetical protein
MEFIYASYNGIKHTYNFRGWPFVGQPSLNRSILFEGKNIIFLCRKNILQRIVSSQISSQTKIWESPDPDDKDKIANFIFEPLDMGTIKWQIENENKCLNEWRRFMKDNNIRFLEVFYEEIFDYRLTLADRIAAIDRIFSFLGYAGTDTLPSTDLITLLGSGNKMSPTELYGRIPNIRKIEETFGANETGWLFA